MRKSFKAVIFLMTIFSVFCGCEGGTVPDGNQVDEHEAELKKVQFAVMALMHHVDVQIDDLKSDSRIDWSNCANSSGEATGNMTGEIQGESKPLIAVNADDRVELLIVSTYVDTDQTRYKYWVEPGGTVHQVVE